MKYWVCEPDGADRFVVFAETHEKALLQTRNEPVVHEPLIRSLEPSASEWLAAGYSIFCEECGHCMVRQGCCVCPEDAGGIVGSFCSAACAERSLSWT